METNINFNGMVYDGEMLPYERYKLYSWISEIKPNMILEVGTGNGGGSTYFIAKSIKDNNFNSVIHTCDPTRKPVDEFFNEFNFVKYYQKNSNEMINEIITYGLSPDFIMFDGPEDPNIAYDDIIFLEKHIEDGTHFCMHDWDYFRPYDNNKSTKSIKIREYMENSKNWLLIEQLHSNKKIQHTMI